MIVTFNKFSVATVDDKIYIDSNDISAVVSTSTQFSDILLKNGKYLTVGHKATDILQRIGWTN